MSLSENVIISLPSLASKVFINQSSDYNFKIEYCEEESQFYLTLRRGAHAFLEGKAASLDEAALQLLAEFLASLKRERQERYNLWQSNSNSLQDKVNIVDSVIEDVQKISSSL